MECVPSLRRTPPMAKKTKDEIDKYGNYGEIIDDNHQDPTLVVLQHEYGVLPCPAKVMSDNLCGDGCQIYIASPDATTCLIVAARATLVFAHHLREDVSLSCTGMIHLDTHGEQLKTGMHSFYFQSLLPLLRATAEKSENYSAITTTESSSLTVEWYIVGGIANEEHTLPIVSDLFSDFFVTISAPEGRKAHAIHCLGSELSKTSNFSVTHKLRSDGVCFWTLNTYFVSCDGYQMVPMSIVRGLRINVVNGACSPFEFRRGHRSYPLKAARSARFLASCDYTPLHPLCHLMETDSPLDNRELLVVNNYRIYNDESGYFHTPPVIQNTVDFHSYASKIIYFVNHVRPSDHCYIVPLFIFGYAFEALSFGYGQLSTEEAAIFSTSPQCEPIDYGETTANMFRLAVVLGRKGFFGQPQIPWAVGM
eukprot:Tbor_TRINITY_DN3044_c0_g1::TRINITY_DN3044_c0_g1_i1::g.17414::m.17414